MKSKRQPREGESKAASLLGDVEALQRVAAFMAVYVRQSREGAEGGGQPAVDRIAAVSTPDGTTEHVLTAADLTRLLQVATRAIVGL